MNERPYTLPIVDEVRNLMRSWPIIGYTLWMLPTLILFWISVDFCNMKLPKAITETTTIISVAGIAATFGALVTPLTLSVVQSGFKNSASYAARVQIYLELTRAKIGAIGLIWLSAIGLTLSIAPSKNAPLWVDVVTLWYLATTITAVLWVAILLRHAIQFIGSNDQDNAISDFITNHPKQLSQTFDIVSQESLTLLDALTAEYVSELERLAQEDNFEEFKRKLIILNKLIEIENPSTDAGWFPGPSPPDNWLTILSRLMRQPFLRTYFHRSIFHGPYRVAGNDTSARAKLVKYYYKFWSTLLSPEGHRSAEAMKEYAPYRKDVTNEFVSVWEHWNKFFYYKSFEQSYSADNHSSDITNEFYSNTKNTFFMYAKAEAENNPHAANVISDALVRLPDTADLHRILNTHYFPSTEHTPDLLSDTAAENLLQNRYGYAISAPGSARSALAYAIAQNVYSDIRILAWLIWLKFSETRIDQYNQAGRYLLLGALEEEGNLLHPLPEHPLSLAQCMYLLIHISCSNEYENELSSLLTTAYTYSIEDTIIGRHRSYVVEWDFNHLYPELACLMVLSTQTNIAVDSLTEIAGQLSPTQRQLVTLHLRGIQRALEQQSVQGIASVAHASGATITETDITQNLGNLSNYIEGFLQLLTPVIAD